jgi:hypothetical protein
MAEMFPENLLFPGGWNRWIARTDIVSLPVPTFRRKGRKELRAPPKKIPENLPITSREVRSRLQSHPDIP